MQNHNVDDHNDGIDDDDDIIRSGKTANLFVMEEVCAMVQNYFLNNSLQQHSYKRLSKIAIDRRRTPHMCLSEV